MVVVVKCKKCGQEFPTTLINVSDENVQVRHSHEQYTETCPSCGQTSNYSGISFCHS